MEPFPLAFAATLAGAATLSAASTALALGYARRRALLDLPGRRRSHTRPTPRGGGIGAVLVIACGALVLSGLGSLPLLPALAFSAGLLAVGAVGWMDDHRPLSARARLLVHLAAGLMLASALSTPGAAWLSWLWFGAILFALAGAVNVWNFMDGIDGLVASQTVWVACCALVAFARHGQPEWALLATTVAAAALGFLPFNFPHARIFMGDVGSGGLGLACGALLLIACLRGALSPWGAGLIASALLFDAALTLWHRMRHRRHWTRAHREHLYQWLVRSGLSHSRVTVIYMAWNLVVVLPLLWLSIARPPLAPACAAAGAMLGAALWYGGKRAVLRRAQETD